jgi:hypothetical protein
VLRFAQGLNIGFDTLLQMSSKTYVCALCSQDFTRRYSAHRHNRDLHHGQGAVVRMVDYVIGRVAGKYTAANPLAYRSRNRHQASASTRVDERLFTPPADSKESIAHDSPQPNSSFTMPHNRGYYPSDHQANTSSSQASLNTPKIGYTTKFEEIEGRARTLYGAERAKGVVREVSIAVIDNGGKEEVLDATLKELQNKMNMMEATRIFFGAPPQETKKRPPLYGHRTEHLHFSELTRTKLEKIEENLDKNLRNEVAVFERIARIIKLCETQPSFQDMILDKELELSGDTSQSK